MLNVPLRRARGQEAWGGRAGRPAESDSRDRQTGGAAAGRPRRGTRRPGGTARAATEMDSTT